MYGRESIEGSNPSLSATQLGGVTVPQQIIRGDVGRQNKPVVLLLHDLDLTLVLGNLEHGDQVVLGELGEDGTTDQIRQPLTTPEKILL